MKNAIMKQLPSLVLGLMMAGLSVVASAEIAVIVNKSNGTSVDEAYLAKIYLGKVKAFPDGASVMPLDQKAGSAIRIKFLEAIVDKTEPQMKAYWSRLIFTGKGVPPEELGSDTDVKKRVAESSEAIGYIDVTSVDDTVKVIKTIP